ncbi:MAG TPA: PQQ-dependent sugar dehydrogenase [Polyangiales bacterium]|nr:PQQ-dependent sugar dehydrogenase [Polyangiales bacterium]
MKSSFSTCLNNKAIALLFISLAAACSDPGQQVANEDLPPASRAPAPGPADEDVALKGGIDGPPVAVAPFLDGVLPPRTPNWPGSSDWTIVPAFPNLDLTDTLVIAANPGNDRIYVGSREGLIVSFENQADVDTVSTFLDLRDRVAVVWDGGFLGLVFHPEFGIPGSPYRHTFYVYYSSHCPLDASRDAPDLSACDEGYPRTSTNDFFNTYLRLSRFEALPGTNTADPDSEQVMLNIRLYNSSHRGGGMAFRDDGYLYLTIGEQFRYDTAQDIVDTLEGGSFRFAVDVTDNPDGSWTCPPGSHLPRRIFDTSDEISGQHYCIPNDNPFLDPAGGVFEEYCSLGHRNPHRLARDPVTDRLWSGEVGDSSREEINVIECGNNYGWPFREGLIAGPWSPPSEYLGTLTDPVIDFDRDEARAIIGGYVYRGTRFPELDGYYLAGDYVTNQVWAILLDENTMTASKAYLANFPLGNLATWGQDNQGEVFLGDVASTGPLYTLDRIGDPVADAPALLSELGAFSDMAAAEPSVFWVPYGLNQPFWSDAALKHRFIALPNDGLRDTAAEKVAFSSTGDWGYPVGTVLMKHFELPLDETDPGDITRLETRFLVLGDDGEWYGLTYRWRPDQTEADLLTTAETDDYTIQLAEGGTRTQTWYFPSRLDCLTCHQQVAGGALGLRTHQLNGDFTYPSTGRTDNQIRTWNDLGMFTPPVDGATIPTLGKSPALEDVTASLQDRARSWLDSNCSYCHRPGGANAGFDARFTTPFANQGMVWTLVRDDLGNPGTVVVYPGDPVRSAAWQRSVAVGPIAMPPLAKALAEEPAVALLEQWIERIDPNVPRSGLNYEYYQISGLTALPDFDSLTPVATGTASSFDISVRQRNDDFALRFSGYLYVDTPGDYVFYTSSDDGSQLFLDDALIVDNDGLHALQEESGAVTLAAGYHDIVVTMFEGVGDQGLFVSWQGPATGGAKTSIGASVLYLQIPTGDTNEPPVLDSPGEQTGRQGDLVTLQLTATDPDGDALYFDAAGLPGGLALDHQTGAISGALTSSGASTVTVSASDGPAVSVVSFAWAVAAPSCGDGIVDDGEECDDSNTEDGDGCSAMCEIEEPPPPDGGLPDAGVPDAGVPDAGVPDAGVPDAGVPDAGVPDGGTTDGGGGGCSVQPGGAPVDVSALWIMLAWTLVRRRRARTTGA